MPQDPFNLSAGRRDLAVGALVGTAAVDALGVGYRLKPPLAAGEPIDMIGRGAHAYST